MTPLRVRSQTPAKDLQTSLANLPEMAADLRFSNHYLDWGVSLWEFRFVDTAPPVPDLVGVEKRSAHDLGQAILEPYPRK